MQCAAGWLTTTAIATAEFLMATTGQLHGRHWAGSHGRRHRISRDTRGEGLGVRFLLAGTSRLVVPARPYIVRAAPSLTPNPGISLPSASTSCCDSQRRASQPAQSSAPPGAHPIESTFATVRLRTKVTKGAGSRRAALAMAYKLVDAAQARWRRIDGYHLTALVRAGAIFIDGQLQERVKS